ncbi:MAG TPA: hypothetical protein VGD71_36910 [Kribbella sp.]
MSCALNAFRHDFVASGQPERQVEIFARIERKFEGDYLGTLIMECSIANPEPVARPARTETTPGRTLAAAAEIVRRTGRSVAGWW